MRQNKLKPTIHNYKSLKYQPIVILHRISKSVLNNYTNKICEPSFLKYDLESCTGSSFSTCETLSERITIDEGRVTKSFKMKTNLTSVNTSKPCKLKSATPILKCTKKSASNLKTKKRNKTSATTETSKSVKLVETSNTSPTATSLEITRCPATLQFSPDMVKELNEIVLTVQDSVTRVNRLISAVEDIMLSITPLTSLGNSVHPEMGEISSQFLHTIKKEIIDLNMCCTKSETVLSEERMDQDAFIDEPGNISTATKIETDLLPNNSEFSHSGSELSLSISPRPCDTPKIVSVLSVGSQSVGEKCRETECI